MSRLPPLRAAARRPVITDADRAVIAANVARADLEDLRQFIASFTEDDPWSMEPDTLRALVVDTLISGVSDGNVARVDARSWFS